jgi:ferredoxin, 2Fe-2S
MTIYFSPAKTHLKPIEVSKADATSKSLMSLLLEAQLPVASSCKGDGICSKCRVHILNGNENLTSESDLEIKTKLKNKVQASERLSCQAFLSGDVTIDTNYW